MNLEKLESGARLMLEGLEGEDLKRAGLVETPKRIAKAWAEILSGYEQDPNDFIKVFPEANADTMVVSEKIQIISACEHHMLPFTGYAVIGYIPRTDDEGKSYLLGYSKLSRISKVFSARLQVQERLTNQIANFIFESSLKPLGVGVYISGVHMCARIRGVKEFESVMKTSALRGNFMTDPAVRAEFTNMIPKG